MAAHAEKASGIAAQLQRMDISDHGQRPTSGTARIAGMDTALAALRELIGDCPTHLVVPCINPI